MQPPDNAKIFDRPLATFWFDKEGILNAVFKNMPLVFENSQDQIDFLKSLTNGKPVCVISDFSHAGGINKEAREYLKKEFSKICKAFAIVSTSALGRMIGTIMSVLTPSYVPTKIFSNEQEAKQWLRQYL